MRSKCSILQSKSTRVHITVKLCRDVIQIRRRKYAKKEDIDFRDKEHTIRYITETASILQHNTYTPIWIETRDSVEKEMRPMETWKIWRETRRATGKSGEAWRGREMKKARGVRKMSSDENFQRRIEKIVSKIIENLGSDVDKARYELSKNTKYITSDLHYVCIKFTSKVKGQSGELSIILKRCLPEKMIRQMMRVDSQFHNEILFYRMYARPDENFARCLYVDEQSPDLVIALENVNKRGYHPCPYTYDGPLEYVLAAIREMGRFHGKGYVMKEQQREKFFNIVKQLQELRYDSTSDAFKFFVNLIAPRTIEYLRNQGHDAIFCDKMQVVFLNAFDVIMMKAVEPVEPLSTLCHGDFTLSNILFKIEDDGQPRAMLIDFAHLRYSTPVIDLSTFLCLCCSNEIRKNKFFEIMQAYHDALKKYLLDAGIQDIEKYSYDALLDNYKTGGLFGFIIASFFLSFLIEDSIDEIRTQTNIDYAKIVKKKGGDKISKILADMLLQMKDFGCLKHFL
ncbi:uncharacterized protein [Polyergus mexicanus]|uniref:uncharacterized protein isoform X1 n=1 Tax=Polyergus mexicanus TaxID=615972 RepID=UPI0038B5A382